MRTTKNITPELLTAVLLQWGRSEPELSNLSSFQGPAQSASDLIHSNHIVDVLAEQI